MLYWRLGWRNIWRNKRRSSITIGALAFSVALLVFFFGFMASWIDQMEENVVGLSVGDLQIHHPMYLADQNLHQVVEGSDGLLEKLRESGFAAAARCYGYGLLASDRNGKSAGAQLKAISLVDEPTVTDLHRQENLYEGRFLSGRTRVYTPSGEEGPKEEQVLFEDPLGGDEELELEQVTLTIGGMVLGKKLAAKLDVHPGDTVNLVTMAADGTMGNELFDVVGVFKNFNEIEDRSLALVSQADYQRLFRLAAGRVHEIAVRVPEGTDLISAKTTVEGLVAGAAETRSWREILPAVAEMMDFQEAALVIFGLTMYVGAGLLIMNSMLMMVFERIREFGVMKAIGLKGRQLVALVFFETFWMSVLAAIAGVAVGVPFTLWIGRVGIDLSTFAPDGFALSGTVIDPVMYARVTPDALLVPLATLFVVAFLSVLYPAVKAAVIEPVKALSHL